MPSIISLDFETYYSKSYSLKTLTIEEYIRHSNFQVLGMAAKVDDDPNTVWFTGKDVEVFLKNIDFSKVAVLCHNTMFDGAILSWIYNIQPMFYLDTLCMARAIHKNHIPLSLGELAKYYNLKQKGGYLREVEGLCLGALSKEQLELLGAYCATDVDITYELFKKLEPLIPDEEMRLINLTTSMFTEPKLCIDEAVLNTRKRIKRAAANKVVLDITNHPIFRTKFGQAPPINIDERRLHLGIIVRSNELFADLLAAYGVTPPTKISAKTGKVGYAFAKTDTAFLDLLQHPDEHVRVLCEYRLNEKSTIEESRIDRFLDISYRNNGVIPVPLRYYGAHTGRWSGMDKVNFQNLPSRDVEKKALKDSVIAPEGYTIVESDSSQIEARVLAWLSGQDDLLEQFRRGDDVYSVFASKLYKRPISKADPIERFVGKTCILGLGYGTGKLKLQATLKTSNPQVELSEEMCDQIVKLYRSENKKIVNLWAECDRALKIMLARKRGTSIGLGRDNTLTVTEKGLQLPNGLFIDYMGLKLEEGQFSYIEPRFGPKQIWGGAVVENIVQALARIIVASQMLQIAEKYKVVLTVHDSVVALVPDSEVDTAKAEIKQIMSTPLDWCANLPLACEVKSGKSYGHLKA